MTHKSIKIENKTRLDIDTHKAKAITDLGKRLLEGLTHKMKEAGFRV